VFPRMRMHRSLAVSVWIITMAGAADGAAAPLFPQERRTCGTTRSGAGHAVWAHRERQARGGERLSAQSVENASFDAGQIAVLLDQGDLALPRNPLDLQGTALRFSPMPQGYSVSRLELPLEPDVGAPIRLEDDDSQVVALPFAFSFYGKRYSELFVNSDGNVSFTQKDDASTERNVSRLLGGPPRIAPLLADLDPSVGGTVSSFSTSDHFSLTWKNVPQFGKQDQNTFQVTLWSDGRIDFVYDAALTRTLDEGVAGIAPGEAAAGLTSLDFSSSAAAVGAGAVAESFRAEDAIDTVAVARRFYATHPDDFQQLVVFTSQNLVSSGTVAYQLTVKQSESGLGDEITDMSREFGSRGTLESFVMMDDLSKYPTDLNRPFVGEGTTLSVLAHETGHRWLAHAQFRDADGVSVELLGRDGVHWSFFLDTDGSFLEGNEIEAVSEGAFRTAGTHLRYSPLDQYLMGLREPAEVPPFFFVRAPTGTSSSRERAPRTGITFGGTRTEVRIEDVVAALGPRRPASTGWTRPFRQAYIYVSVGAVEAGALEKIEAIRTAFPAFFLAGTEGRGAVDTRLN
jgi:hypothetical protein